MQNQKSFAYLLLAIAAAALAGSYVLFEIHRTRFALEMYMEQGDVPQVLVIPSEARNLNMEKVVSNGPSANAEQFDASTWQTYRNEEYGFEFKYPTDWTMKRDIGDTGYSFIGLKDPTLGQAGDTMTIEEYDGVTESVAIKQAGLVTRADVQDGDFLGGRVPEGEYFWPGSSAGPAMVAEKSKIGEYQSLIARFPTRAYGTDGTYAGASDGMMVLLYGKDGNYANVSTQSPPTDTFDQILSTFRFLK